MNHQPLIDEILRLVDLVVLDDGLIADCALAIENNDLVDMLEVLKTLKELANE